MAYVTFDRQYGEECPFAPVAHHGCFTIFHDLGFMHLTGSALHFASILLTLFYVIRAQCGHQGCYVPFYATRPKLQDCFSYQCSYCNNNCLLFLRSWSELCAQRDRRRQPIGCPPVAGRFHRQTDQGLPWQQAWTGRGWPGWNLDARPHPRPEPSAPDRAPAGTARIRRPQRFPVPWPARTAGPRRWRGW